MGLFSLFKKGKPDAADDDGEAAARLAADSQLQRQQAHSQLQRDLARATALKIDAIEAAMAADIFNEPEPAWGSRPLRPAPPAAAVPDDTPATLPLLDASTTQLLADDEMPAPVAALETAPVVEESAILYANGQGAVAGPMLRAAIADAASQGMRQDRTPWWLLFDLYQAEGRQDAFDDLSIDYASTFEVSPPAWRGPASGAGAADGGAAMPGHAAGAYSGIVHTHSFPALLDARLAEPLAQLHARQDGMLRLDFSRVASADAAGCALVLDTLRVLQARQQELVVVAAAELAQTLRASLRIGRRDEGEAPWLLLLEMLQLLNREKDFEETSMDYCITFEVSPPAFAPPRKVETAARQPPAAAASQRYLLPPLVAGETAALLAAITAYAEQHAALVFDCSRLARIEYGAANQLLAHLAALADGERRVEFREVNHLVAALLRLLGYASLGRIFAYKY